MSLIGASAELRRGHRRAGFTEVDDGGIERLPPCPQDKLLSALQY